MPRIWLRLELFEHGLLQFPSKYAATLTLANVKRSLDALHTRFKAHQETEGDVNMDAGGEPPSSPTAASSTSAYTERDNLHRLTFPQWKEAVAPIFEWREQDYKAFWLLLVHFHRKIPVKEPFMATAGRIFDAEQCLIHESVPMFKLVIFLFIQTVKPHSWRTKYAIESFNAVWYREDAAVLAGTTLVGAAAAAAVASAGNGSMSPQFKGSSSPPPPPSPHTVGMQDRSTSDAYYLEFIREKVEDLFSLLYPSAEMDEASAAHVTAEQVDLLGFLLCAGGRNMLDVSQSLSAAYPKWHQQAGASPFAESYKSGASRTENAVKICRFFKKHLYLNDTLYPPVGFTLTHPPGGSYSPVLAHAAKKEFSLEDTQDMTDDESNVIQRPTVLTSLSRTTVIKRAEDFADKQGHSDLVVFSCHDCYIYILGPVRHVMITACNNCKIVTAPNSGIYCIDRCENVNVTAVSGLIRVSNCLDSVINSYALVPLIMTGENVGVRLGPYNSKYPGLREQLQVADITYSPDSQGSWDSFLNIEDDTDKPEGEKESISLQPPSAFREVCVPVKIRGMGPAERPFALPPAYMEVLRGHQETVDSLRRLVCSDEFDLATKRAMEAVIQARFKEWLSATGNVRQILDLVQIEKARAHQSHTPSPSPSPSPLKERA